MTYNVIPSVLAVGEALRSNGREIIEAFAVGYEIQAKLALHAPGMFAIGHHTSPTTGAVGSAVGAAKLLQLSPDQIRHAMSTAATNACGLMRQTGYMCHLVECGLAAKNGVTAALWARDGFTGDPEIIEGSRGFIDTYSAGQYDLKGLVESLGKPFRIMEVGIKQYPCCYFTQRLIDGVKDLKEKYKLSADDVDVIEVYTAPYFRRLIHYPDPANGEEARFSIEHILAAVLLGEKIFLDLFTVEKVNDPRIVETKKKIKAIPDPSREKDVTFMSGNDKVIVKLKNGKQHEIICKVAKGDPPNYMSESQVKAMLKDCVAYAGFLSDKNLDRVCDIVFNLEKVNDITELMNTVTFDPR
jgi:2-methylcitrate dehydratase PrpD